MFPHMNTYYDRNLYSLTHGAHPDTKSDLYRAKYGFPLNESPERFLAARTLPRKNKDYRPRFRSFSIGFPVYKKDNYFRHWFNLLEIIKDKESPIMKYTKTFLTGSSLALFYYAMQTSFDMSNGGLLRNRKVDLSKDYTKSTLIIDSFRKLIKFQGRKIGVFGAGITVWFIVSDYLRKHAQLSINKSSFVTSLILSPPLLFLLKDKLIPQFFFASFLLSFLMCKMF
jgi:hypothetical protein